MLTRYSERIFNPMRYTGHIYKHIPRYVFISQTSELNSKTVPVLPPLNASLTYIFNILSSPMQPTRFSFYVFPGFLAIYILSSSNNNNHNENVVIILGNIGLTTVRYCAIHSLYLGKKKHW